MEKAPDTYNVRAVERAMQILSALDGEHADRGVSEIAQATGLHKATTHRIMMTLLNGGFLERARHGEKFRLGIRVVELALDAQWIHLQAAAERVAGDVVDDQGTGQFEKPSISLSLSLVRPASTAISKWPGS